MKWLDFNVTCSECCDNVFYQERGLIIKFALASTFI
jgi:hypothetical protein